MSQFLKIFVGFLFCVFAHNLSAQEILTDRPDQTETASAVSKGLFQIESGYSLNKIPEETSLTLFSNLYRYGIGSGIELRLAHEVIFYKVRSENETKLQFSDIEIGGKYGFTLSGIDVALLSHLVLPSRSEDDDSKVGVITKLAFSRDLSESVGFGCNFGYDYLGKGKGDYTFSAALGFSLTESIGFYTEIYGGFLERSKSDIYYDNGFTYLIKENLQFDFSFGTGLTEPSNFVAVGLSWCTM